MLNAGATPTRPLPRRVWDLLTAPSTRVGSESAARQSRVLSASLVILLPLYAAMAITAGVTRTVEVGPVDKAIGVGLFAGGVIAYALNRTADYWRGGVIITGLAIAGALVVGYRDPDPARALSTLLFGLTGVIYPSFLLSPRFTTWSAAVYAVGTLAVSLAHPVVPLRDFVIADFLAVSLAVLTVAGARLRAAQAREIRDQSKVILESEARLRATLESALDALVVIDAEGRVTEWSRHAEALLGHGAGHAQGRPLADLIDPEGKAAELRPRIAKLQRGRFEIAARAADGHAFACEVSMAPLTGGRGGALFLRDVSERKQLQGKLILADRMESMGRMVGGVAHEINNPLAFVVANLSHVESELTEKRPAGSAELLEVLSETRGGVKRVQKIVADLRTFSYGGESEELHPVDVEATLGSAVQIALGHMRSQKVNLVTELGGVGRVLAQESRLGQVFLNLLMNAVQAFPPEGSGERLITVRTRRDGGTVLVSVRDNAQGITSEVMRRLFTPFFTTKPVGQGTGLGLYICHAIVSGLKGELSVESELGQGSTFTVSLPALPDEAR